MSIGGEFMEELYDGQIAAFKETIKYALIDATERANCSEINDKIMYASGEEKAYLYCLEMIDKHFK